MLKIGSIFDIMKFKFFFFFEHFVRGKHGNFEMQKIKAAEET